MVHGLPIEKKKRKSIKRNSPEWLHKDMLISKRAVESYCNEVGTKTEKEMKKSKS